MRLCAFVNDEQQGEAVTRGNLTLPPLSKKFTCTLTVPELLTFGENGEIQPSRTFDNIVSCSIRARYLQHAHGTFYGYTSRSVWTPARVKKTEDKNDFIARSETVLKSRIAKSRISSRPNLKITRDVSNFAREFQS